MAVVMFGVPLAALYSTVISVPVAGADLPEASMELKMFSTDVAVSELFRSHVSKKQFAAGVPVHELKKFAGNVASDVQFLHVS
jgi:hypothetical protein